MDNISKHIVLSKHISYQEAVKSHTAIREGIDNTPNEGQLRNMTVLANKVFEPLRKGLGDKPINIGSFFRCRGLNTVVGGVINSEHKAEFSAAMDIDNDGHSPTNRDIFFYIYDNLEYNQLIWEYGDGYSPDWVHVSFSESKNKKQTLIKTESTYSYIPFIDDRG